MNEKHFWEIIDSTKHATPEEQDLLLGETLRQLSPEEILAFDTLFIDMQDRFPAQSTCALFTLLRQEGYYLSDDSWHYFLSWLILQGKEVYEQALQEPATLLPLITQAEPITGQLPERETGAYVAQEVMAEKTGRDIWEYLKTVN